ncbi:transcription initiation factor TFIID subunit 4-like isoform X2 [Watersipora subatra]|uniref:transcription initiation factor TFIID subunit 4-like isoform X2 n=1 Tax=Watersipora subatra TaxID=2589382 RepID=UPI00355B9BE7
MSTTPVQIVRNGDKVNAIDSNGPSTTSNGVVMTVNVSSSATVNGNGQLGASGAMFNLAKIASSEQKQQPININTTTAPTTAVLGSSSHSVVCTGTTVNPVITQQVINVNAQPRATLAQPNVATTRPTMSQPLIIPRGTNTISLPPGVQLPPGTILMQNDKGQIVFMSRAPAPQNQPANSGGTIPIQPSPAPGQVIMRPAVPGSLQQIRSQGPANLINRQIMPQPALSQAERSKEEIKKCKNFLETLIRLSSQQPRHTLDNVKKLIQGLLDGNVQPDVFTTKLQKELNSQKQPGLAAFLKKSLPELRKAIKRNELTIEGLGPTVPASNSSSTSITPTQNIIRPTTKPVTSQMPKTQAQFIPGGVGAQQVIRPTLNASPMRQPLVHSRLPTAMPSNAPKGKQRLDLKDDDDINDVATMGGVNLSEETKNILAAVPDSSGQLRSCRDDVFLSHTPLAQKIRQLALQRGIRDVNSDVISLVSHACEERLRHLTEKVSLAAEHRLDIYRMDKRFDATHDVRSQLKFLEELDKLERKKHDDSEREVLLKAAKSRSKTEDPEQAKLKLKAREMKEQELEEMRQQEANKTALAAIGPRKKRRFDELISGAAAGGSGSSNSFSSPNAATSNQGYNRPRLKRVVLRDLTFVLEEDKESYKSETLFKTFLR